MAWLRDNRTKIFIISTTLAVIAGIWGLHQQARFDEQHEQYQKVVIYDMGIVVDNQKNIRDSLEDIMENGSLATVKAVQTHLAYNYSELPVNPQTGQP